MNVGRNESKVRILLGVACLGAACTVERLGGWRWLLAASGAAELITGLTRYCPVNQALGIDNTQGDELVHFREDSGYGGTFGRRMNRLQQRIGFNVQ